MYANLNSQCFPILTDQSTSPPAQVVNSTNQSKSVLPPRDLLRLYHAQCKETHLKKRQNKKNPSVCLNWPLTEGKINFKITTADHKKEVKIKNVTILDSTLISYLKLQIRCRIFTSMLYITQYQILLQNTCLKVF